MSVQTYTYDGPEELHALVGQVMASLGYVGGREGTCVGAAVVVRAAGGHLALRCTFRDGGAPWVSEAVLLGTKRQREAVKDCLIHWYDRFSGRGPSPWGTLIGVRPTKLVHHLFDQGLDDRSAAKTLEGNYHVAPETARRLVAMARLQRPYVTDRGRKLALYVGIPYCASHCLYCSFPSRLIGREGEGGFKAFRDAVLADLDDLKDLCRTYDLDVTSLYVGGGTPTCLPQAILQPILEKLAGNFPHVREWTVEAGRPDTAKPEMLAMLRACGVDRISVNPQTMQQRLLDALGRRHSVADIYTMYENCRKLGFSVVNMDFIAGLPGQTLADMQENMEIVCKLHPENVTIHTLALKKRAPLFHHVLRAAVPPAEETGRMVRLCRTVLTAKGYLPYYMYRQKYMAASFANTGYALPGSISAYNIEMMEERQSVLAAGPGGATKFLARDGHTLEKVYMPKDVDAYIGALPEKMAQRRRLCAIIYGGEI